MPVPQTKPFFENNSPARMPAPHRLRACDALAAHKVRPRAELDVRPL